MKHVDEESSSNEQRTLLATDAINAESVARREQYAAVQKLLKSVEDERRERKDRLLSEPTSPNRGLLPDFVEGDNRLSLRPNANDDTLLGELVKVGPVVCYKVNSPDMRIGKRGIRIVEIYQQLALNTLVQPFYGILSYQQHYYGVMQDLQSELTVSAAIMCSKLPEIRSRLGISYDICSTVAYFHSVNLIVKNLTDLNVILRKKGDQRLEPVLTEVEGARKVIFLNAI